MTHRRAKTLLSDPDLTLRLSWYEPGEAMSAHAHEHEQISVLLAGGFREMSDARTADIATAHIGFKASGLDHANHYGPAGALILSVNFESERRETDRAWNWRPAETDEVRLTRQIVGEALTAAELRNAATDLIAAAAAADSPAGPPPVWARQLRDQLRTNECIDLDRAAAGFGIHRGHLSRGFRKWFGAPPSLYGLRCRMSHAVQELARGESAAQAAAAAGFSDQSHMTRIIKRETGLTPQRLSRILAA
ncbi:helix-turn-helix domain-containing protein [Hyphobacterium sp.]|uniref:helix-turn-helix transcriptional regulator n=1 Tax=Hyphobacterium sp. TaxID=2004662 RepID=UPI003748C59F